MGSEARMIRLRSMKRQQPGEHRLDFEESEKKNFFEPKKRSFKPYLLRFFMVAAAIMLISIPLIYAIEYFFSKANVLGRKCMEPIFPDRRFRFAMVSCSDGSTTIPHRPFNGIMELVLPNKRIYARQHGYDFFDASEVVDKHRPPSWSKILAVSKYLADYDWVFWNDADSLITNPEITLDSVVVSLVGDIEFERMPDFILTEDVTGVNAGMFFFRNSPWSHQFLDLWWNQTEFIKPFGETKSGDNDALKYLIKNMSVEERKEHVHIAQMQCSFNSYLWRPTWKSMYRLILLGRTVWRGAYAEGDFLVHLAGIDDKRRWIKQFLEMEN